MKILLAVAMGLNLILTVALVRSLSRPHPIAISAPAVPVPVREARPVTVTVVASAPVQANGPGWQSWLGQLRAAGVPDKVLAGLVISDFEDRWEKKNREMQRRYHAGDLDAGAMEQFTDGHDAGQEEELKAALGGDGFVKWDKERTLGDLETASIALPASDADALYQLRKDLAQKQRELAQAHSGGEIDEADFDESQAATQKDYDQKLKALLGHERYAALQHPDESAKGDLVRNLKDVNATDSQFQALLAAQKQWNDQRAKLDQQAQASPDASASLEEQVQAIDAARDAEYQRVLGTNGYDAFQRAQDSRYQTLQRYAAAWQLTGENIDHLYRALQYSQKTVQDYLQQARAMEAQGQAVDWPQVEANVRQFSSQTQQSLRSYLGPDRFEKLQKNSVFESTDE